MFHAYAWMFREIIFREKKVKIWSHTCRTCISSIFEFTCDYVSCISELWQVFPENCFVLNSNPTFKDRPASMPPESTELRKPRCHNRDLYPWMDAQTLIWFLSTACFFARKQAKMLSTCELFQDSDVWSHTWFAQCKNLKHIMGHVTSPQEWSIPIHKAHVSLWTLTNIGLLLSCHRPPIGPCQPCLTKGGRTRTRSLLIQPLAPLAACEGKVGQHVGQKLLCKSLAAGTSMLIMVVFCGF